MTPDILPSLPSLPFFIYFLEASLLRCFHRNELESLKAPFGLESHMRIFLGKNSPCLHTISHFLINWNFNTKLYLNQSRS